MPELEHFPERTRRIVLNTRRRITFTAGMMLCALVGGAIVGFLITEVAQAQGFLSPNAPGLELLIVASIALPIGLGLYRVALAAIRAEIRRELARSYRGQRLPFCIQCGYGFDGITTGECPECGSSAVMQTRLTEQDSG
jgi:hypothetical protein